MSYNSINQVNSSNTTCTQNKGNDLTVSCFSIETQQSPRRRSTDQSTDFEPSEQSLIKRIILGLAEVDRANQFLRTEKFNCITLNYSYDHFFFKDLAYIITRSNADEKTFHNIKEIKIDSIMSNSIISNFNSINIFIKNIEEILKCIYDNPSKFPNLTTISFEIIDDVAPLSMLLEINLLLPHSLETVSFDAVSSAMITIQNKPTDLRDISFKSTHNTWIALPRSATYLLSIDQKSKTTISRH